MSQRPFAVFDIDGTLIRWQLYHAIADALGVRGLVPKKDYQTIHDARMLWKRRSSESSFNAYEHKLVAVYDKAIVGLSSDELLELVRQVFAEYKDQVYTYTRDLIHALKAKNYLLFAISGSQVEIVQLLADYYGFDAAAGSIYEQKSGKLTGKRQSLRRERKVEVLNNLINKFDATRKDSLAIGDSESDILILNTVETAIAFNPTQELFDQAKAKGWQVVIERKNMIYELRPENGQYLLA